MCQNPCIPRRSQDLFIPHRLQIALRDADALVSQEATCSFAKECGIFERAANCRPYGGIGGLDHGSAQAETNTIAGI